MNINHFLNTFKGDRTIWIVVLMLTLVSVMAVYSSTESLAIHNKREAISYLVKHMILIMLAFGIMWVVHNIPYQYFGGLYKIVFPISFIALLVAHFFGQTINGASRWIMIPIFDLTFQASDVAKLGVVLYLSRTLSKNQDRLSDLKGFFLPMLFWCSLICFAIFIDNVSTSIMVFATCFTMMFLGRVHLLHLFGVLAIVAIITAFGVILVLKTPSEKLFWRLPTAKARIEAFMNNKKEEVSYQVKQSNMAIARGGILPNGPGNSRQKNFLPNAFSDYVFAIIIEEWGLIGGLFLLMLYLVIMYRTILIVIKSPQTYGALLALGLGMSIVLQALLNMCVNVGLFPSTGVTLPLVSMGGSSVIFIGIALGIIISVSRGVETNEIGKAPSKEHYLDELTLNQ